MGVAPAAQGQVAGGAADLAAFVAETAADELRAEIDDRAAELAAEACTPLLRQTGSNHRMLRAVLSLPSRSASRSCSK